ncbi:hypothetical protein GCM10010191_52090 [Actinomadura vinacea]|uniref:Protein kinase domain-containing protein n=1 Tax=Actinomadura vinacea TaxID=115336 RepID=A0ABN3JIY9_9ACTN
MHGNPLPAAEVYHTAVLNPAQCFSDPDLQAAKVERNGILLPQGGGNFSSVFRMRSADGRRAWAVKCYHRRIPDLAERYAAIGSALAAVPEFWKVGFDFQPAGVLDPATRLWWPIVRMDWVNGRSLIPWLDRNHASTERVRGLAAEFAKVVGSMERNRIAHGDLQHGNVIVVAGQRIKLIDYDGMYVPGLPERTHEAGMRHYQAPTRIDQGHLGSAGDRFSARVIYTSLLAVAAAPDVWTRLHRQGGEHLLFQDTDFREPGSSQVFQALLGMPDPVARETRQLMRDLEAADPELIPPIDGAAAIELAASRRLRPKVSGLPAWLAGEPQAPAAMTAEPERTARDTSRPRAADTEDLPWLPSRAARTSSFPPPPASPPPPLKSEPLTPEPQPARRASRPPVPEPVPFGKAWGPQTPPRRQTPKRKSARVSAAVPVPDDKPEPRRSSGNRALMSILLVALAVAFAIAVYLYLNNM